MRDYKANRVMVQLGYMAVDFRRHSVQPYFVASGILLDNRCVSSTKLDSCSMWVNSAASLQVRRQTSSGAGAGSAFDQKTRKWITLYDFEPSNIDLGGALLNAGMNKDSVVLVESPAISPPFWLCPESCLAPRELLVTIKMCVNHVSELPDLRAHLSYSEQTSNSPSRERDRHARFVRLAESIPITAGHFLPIEWEVDHRGVMYIVALTDGLATCKLYAVGNWACFEKTEMKDEAFG